MPNKLIYFKVYSHVASVYCLISIKHLQSFLFFTTVVTFWNWFLGVSEYLSTEICTSRQKRFSLVTFVDSPGLVDGDMKYPFDVDEVILWLGVLPLPDCVCCFFWVFFFFFYCSCHWSSKTYAGAGVVTELILNGMKLLCCDFLNLWLLKLMWNTDHTFFSLVMTTTCHDEPQIQNALFWFLLAFLAGKMETFLKHNEE